MLCKICELSVHCAAKTTVYSVCFLRETISFCSLTEPLVINALQALCTNCYIYAIIAKAFIASWISHSAMSIGLRKEAIKIFHGFLLLLQINIRDTKAVVETGKQQGTHSWHKRKFMSMKF